MKTINLKFKNLVIVTLITCSLLGCSEDIKNTNETGHTKRVLFERENEEYLLKSKFALALHKAMINDVSTRNFLKNEALKKFNGDYDVLYNYIKNEKINNYTLRQILLNYFDSEEELQEIEAKIPTLTIFIPTLPEDCFSAEKWDTNNQIPLVAVRLSDYNKTPIIASDQQSFTLDSSLIPAFPVVVVKDNERVTVPEFSGYDSNINDEYYSSDGTFRFRFLQNIFDRIINRLPNALLDGNLDPQIIEAWNVNGKNQNIGWQRDHVYYNINTANPNGPFINNHQERISSFKVIGNTGLAALNKIAQPNGIANLADPSLLPVHGSPNGGLDVNSFWTDGDFEFNVYLYQGSNSSSEGSRKDVGFDASPTQLFDIQFTKEQFFWVYVYKVTNVTAKKISTNVELVTWNLERYSNSWKINIEEVDATQEVTNTTTENTKYNSNFGLDMDDIWKKIGIKLGTSSESNITNTTTTKYTVGSNNLGDTSPHFGDNIIVNESSTGTNTFYSLREYSSGNYTISIRPVKVQ